MFFKGKRKLLSSSTCGVVGGTEETEYTKKKKVHCDGQEFSGHPRVFLTFGAGEYEVVCPYCSKKFVLLNDETSREDVFNEDFQS